MAGTNLGVYPVFDIEFLISTDGVVSELAAAALETMVEIKEMETFSPSIEGNVEEWTPMDQKGWMRRLMTGKSFSITLTGKRNEGDPGNDYIADLALKTGKDCTTTVGVKFPNGDAMLFNSVVNVTTPFGGDSTDVSNLEAELMSDGKPEWISGALAAG